MVHFSRGTLDKNGKFVLTEGRDIEQSNIQKCPHTILVAEHYRADQTCRCDDESNTDMAEWGYVWDGKLWQ